MRALESGHDLGSAPRWRLGGRGLRAFAVLLLASLLLTESSGDLLAQAVAPDAAFLQTTRRYRLVEGSSVVEDCIGCDDPTLEIPLEGELWIRPGGACTPCNAILPLDLRLVSRDPASHAFVARGQGSLRLLVGTRPGTLVAQELRLRLSVWADGGAEETVSLHSGVVPVSEPPPWIDVAADETLGDEPASPHSRRLRIVAAPWPAMLLSTSRPFTSGASKARIGAGDLISAEGFRPEDGVGLIRNSELTARLGIMPPVPDLGLDAALLRWSVDTGPAAIPAPEVVFSTSEGAFSETLGPLGPGDLLSADGRVVLPAARWLRAFSPLVAADDPEGLIADPGLDAACLLPDGRIAFSVETAFFSETLGRTVLPGDILTDDGQMLRAEGDLLARFGPAADTAGAGLDAVFVWPHGEIWFSTERSFPSAAVGLAPGDPAPEAGAPGVGALGDPAVGDPVVRGGTVLAGDLLSDRGRVVLRNADLLRPWSPVEVDADLGLDALAIDAEPQFVDCGFLVEGIECVLLRADCGGAFVIPGLRGFVPGDRVRVAGKLTTSCTTFCQEGDGCILGAVVEPCDFDGCGRLVEVPAGCIVFRAELGRDFLLDDLGDFQVGDRVRVTGPVRTGCNSACVTPCAAIVGNTISPCVVETCGELVEVAPGCIVFLTANGDRYVVENVGDFRAGDAVFVVGELADASSDACRSECAAIAGAVGCIRDNEVEAAGPIGEVGFFRRADCNADGKHDLSDPVYNLLHLFSGGSPPVCPESCDSNADGQVDIADSIFALGFLFLGGTMPPQPFPSCGEATKRVECEGKPCPCLYPEIHCEDR